MLTKSKPDWSIAELAEELDLHGRSLEMRNAGVASFQAGPGR